MLASILLSLVVQSDTVRLAERMCATCVISVDTVVWLGEPDGQAVLDWELHVSADARGRYWVVSRIDPSRVIVFSPAGRFIRTFGASGGGPGEFRRILRIFPLRDGMALYDDFAKRITRVHLDFSLRGSSQIDAVPQSLIDQGDGTMLISAIVKTPERIGFTLHETDSLGAIRRSFGLNAMPYREDLRDLFIRDLAPSRGAQHYWVSHRREYAFGRCAYADNTCRLYLRAASWFPRPTAAGFSRRDMSAAPPHPRLIGVSQDDSRYVWTLSWVADARWRSALVPANATEYRVVDFSRYFDSVIERIDVSTNRVVASIRMDQVLWSFIAPGQAWFFDERDPEPSRVAIVRFAMSGQP